MWSGAQVSTNALPQVIQTALAPVFGLYKTASQLHRLLQAGHQILLMIKQAGGVQTTQAIFCQQLAALPQPVGTGNFHGCVIPQHQLLVVVVIHVQIPAFAGAFTGLAEGDFSQPTQLA